MFSVFGKPLVVIIHGNLKQQQLVVTSLEYIVPTHNFTIVTRFIINWTFY